MYTRLWEAENTINGVLVDKIAREVENRRLRKVIAQAERKLELLGNQLIRVARDSLDYRDEDEEDQD